MRALSCGASARVLAGAPARSRGWGVGLASAASLADVGSLALVAWLVTATPIADRGRSATAALALLAVAPVSIMVSGFHGNTDPVMMFFVLLWLYCLEVWGGPWAAGAAFGMALNVKALPLIFVPAVVLYVSRRGGLPQRRAANHRGRPVVTR